MRKLYNDMVLETAQIKAEPMIQIGGLNRLLERGTSLINESFVG
ncbi:MAG: hypothetical protein WKF34_01920 [Pyrinomonadaceae bacterium]